MQEYIKAQAAIDADSPEEREMRIRDERKLYRSKYTPHIGEKQRLKGLKQLQWEHAKAEA